MVNIYDVVGTGRVRRRLLYTSKHRRESNRRVVNGIVTYDEEDCTGNEKKLHAAVRVEIVVGQEETAWTSVTAELQHALTEKQSVAKKHRG